MLAYGLGEGCVSVGGGELWESMGCGELGRVRELVAWFRDLPMYV